MTASIFARVASLTKGDWLMTRETVFLDTFARRAMSLMVARRPPILSVTFAADVGSKAAVRVAVVFVFDMRVGVRDLALVVKRCRSVRVTGGWTKARATL